MAYDLMLQTGGTKTTVTPTHVKITGVTMQDQFAYVTGTTYITGSTYVTGTTVISGETVVTGATIITGHTVITGDTRMIQVPIPTEQWVLTGITTTSVFTGLTAQDGSHISAGILKFEARFEVGTTNVRILSQFFRNLQVYQAGFRFLNLIEIPSEINLSFTEEEYFTITPPMLYLRVRDKVNEILGVPDAFEIIEY